MNNSILTVELINQKNIYVNDIDKSIFDLNNQLDDLISHADSLDYFVAASSGILCAMLDIFWVGKFDLARGRKIGQEEADDFVKKVAHMMGCKDDEVKSCVKYLEDMFPLAADGNTPDFGGGLQHHLRDFAHHPTIIGLMFSILTQFTKMSYGTDALGNFIVKPVPEKSLKFIGEDISDKLFKGTVIWMFHLVSDLAGSSSTAGLSGGTGIPGPILSLAKELSVLPGIKEITVNEDSLSKFLSKLFNGTLFAEHDANGKIIKGTEIKFDFRSELGALSELGMQAIPVIANECIVRSFYFIRRLTQELKESNIKSLSDIKDLNWNNIKPFGNPTITRMLLVSTGVFTAIDVTEAIVSETYFVSINYVGIGRFTIALGAEMMNALKTRDVKRIKAFYETIEKNTYTKHDNQIYERIGQDMDYSKMGLTVEQTEILYNLELFKTINDANHSSGPLKKDKIKELKLEWASEWKSSMEAGFASFVDDENATLHWYSVEELKKKIKDNNPKEIWFRLAILEMMIFEPYYPLSIEKDKKGNDIPSEKYKSLNNPINGYKEKDGDKFIDMFFDNTYYEKGYVFRLRKTYGKVTKELNEVLKSAITGIAISAGVALAVVITAGAFAPAIAVALVGSNFAGLSGAALTSACLAYLGGGAVAIGGLGMAGGTAVIVGGGAILGVGVGAGVGGTISAAGILGKKATIAQSAKLMVSVREIFLNDEKDLEYSNTIYEQYVKNISDIEKGLVDLKLKENVASKEEKKLLKHEIKNTEESVHAMKIAMKSMNKFRSSFEIGMNAAENITEEV